VQRAFREFETTRGTTVAPIHGSEVNMSTTSQPSHPPTDQPSNALRSTLDELRTMRDEIRVRLHLAGMEAKDTWNRDLEPRFFTLEKRLERDVGDAAKTALEDLRNAMNKFRDNLKH
jgi:hypothetical protein